jgi:hypothetical protein
MTVSRRMLAQLCSTLSRKCRTQSFSVISSAGTGVWQPGRQDIGSPLSSTNPPSEPVKLFMCNGNTKSSMRQSRSEARSSRDSCTPAFGDRVPASPRMGP